MKTNQTLKTTLKKGSFSKFNRVLDLIDFEEKKILLAIVYSAIYEEPLCERSDLGQKPTDELL